MTRQPGEAIVARAVVVLAARHSAVQLLLRVDPRPKEQRRSGSPSGDNGEAAAAGDESAAIVPEEQSGPAEGASPVLLQSTRSGRVLVAAAVAALRSIGKSAALLITMPKSSERGGVRGSEQHAWI
jgi:hypothetical protein